MKRFRMIVFVLMFVFAITPITAQAASYDNISRKIGGYGVSVSKKTDQKLSTDTVSELVNRKKYAVKTTDKCSISKDITFSASCSSSISGSIGVTDGVVSGSLGSKIQSSYSFKSNYVRKYTKTISAKVPAKKTYKVKATIKGDVVDVYYKFFVVWITTSKGNGKVSVPKYCSWTCC